jgi:Tfp pilus assembly pilus retraction ATPase PilT
MTEETIFGSEFILNITGLLAELGATDIYLSLGLPLMVRYRGEVRAVGDVLGQALKGNEEGLPEGLGIVAERVANAGEMLAYHYISYIAKNLWGFHKIDGTFLLPLFEKRAMDIGMSLHRGYRARIHAFFSQAQLPEGFAPGALEEDKWYQVAASLRYVIRIIPPIPSSIEELGLTPALEQQFLNQRGLYLVVGPTASGKSTTVAYLAQSASYRKTWHIVTLEDPVEYLIVSGASVGGKGGIVHQRERGRDFNSFPEAMHQALRESPDLIVVGEIRDEETLNWTLFLAEAGFTILATYHTSSFVETIQRITASFPPEQRTLVAQRLASVLRAVVAQRLVKGKTGMRLVYEYVPVTGQVIPFIQNPGVGLPPQQIAEFTWERSIEYWVAQGELGKEDAIRIKAEVQSPTTATERSSPSTRLFGKP